MSMNLEQTVFLLVDEDFHMRALIRSVLRSFGVKSVIEAKTGKDAVDIIKNSQVDLVITDWMMKRMDGLELTQWLRKDPESPNKFMPIVMATANTEVRNVELARDAGISEFLAKPVSPAGLYQRIQKAILEPRVFVDCGDYSGPCRRRRAINKPGMTERRAMGEKSAPANDTAPAEAVVSA